MTDPNPSAALAKICAQVAEIVVIEEGPPGVENILRQVHRSQPVSARDVAKHLGMPVPLVSAIRRELEKAGWLDRKNGMILSGRASLVAHSVWGEYTPPPAPLQPDFGQRRETGEPNESDEPTAEEDASFLEGLEDLFEQRPQADPKWDQSHATFETTLARADLFIDIGLIQGKRSLFLGDDDLTCLTTFLMLKHELGGKPLENCRATILEVDQRLVSFIREIANTEGLPIEVRDHDLRNPLPEDLENTVDFFFTDPPYTKAGADLFLERGCRALAPEGSLRAGLAIPLSPPALQRDTQRSILSKGLVVDLLDPTFNEYTGATMQGGVSALYLMTQTEPGRAGNAPFQGNLYTAGNRPKKKGRGRR